MPATRPATVRRSDLDDVVTPSELAAYLRLDVRTIRKAIEAGEIIGAERYGRSWRIDMTVFGAAKARTVV